jgi:flagellar hook-basal body complex protein FliE
VANPISALSNAIAGAALRGPSGPAEAPKSDDNLDFAGTLADAIGSAGDAERNATEQAERFAAGDQSVGIHEVMIASEKASISLRFAVTAKNQALAAYRELMNTSV